MGGRKIDSSTYIKNFHKGKVANIADSDKTTQAQHNALKKTNFNTKRVAYKFAKPSNLEQFT